MGKLFERVARMLLYTALLFAVYTLIGFEVMITFGFAIIIVDVDELDKK